MAKHRTHSDKLKRQVAEEYLVRETVHGLAKRHDICLIRVWVQTTTTEENGRISLRELVPLVSMIWGVAAMFSELNCWIGKAPVESI